ncbi:MAG TPA: hypothetical protein VG672_16330 [Bryobacteraceae bacterium]|nr:hypothetical protein [Bryobacteraceae bacterium]
MAQFLIVLAAALLWGGPPAAAQSGKQPQWVKQGLVMASNMEALSFVRRRGGQASNYTELWEKEQTEAAILELKKQGVNAVLVSLMKGAGIRAEADDIEAARKYVELAHRHGMKVGGYIGASIFFETMFEEEPDSPNWIQRDEHGKPMYYNPTQTFRYMANRNQPGYRNFIKRVLKLGIGDLKMDFVHFDQMMWWRLPYVSQTDVDQELFRKFVRDRYPPERMKVRFGYADLGKFRLPEFGFTSPTITWSEVVEPLMQELMHFRSWTLAERFREYEEYIRQLNPEAALQANPSLDPSANNAVQYGVDVPQLLSHGDIITSEERNEPQYTADGRLISRIRTYRAGRTMGKPILFWQQPAVIVGRPAHHILKSEPRLRLAEALAFCDNCVGLTAGLDVGNARFAPNAQKYIDFYWKHNDLLAGAESAAEVAVLRSFASVELNGAAVLPQVVLLEQSLIQAQIPFDTIFDRHLDKLNRYKVLVLANQDALSQEQVEKIRAFVQGGGALVATGNSSLYTEWRLRRPKPALSDVLGFETPPAHSKRGTFGSGRTVYLPLVEPAVQPPPAQLYYAFRNEFWKLPKNHAEIVNSVQWALGSATVRVTAPDWVAVEATEQKQKSRRLVHLVNYKTGAPVLNATVKLRVPEGKRLREVVAESPDTAKPVPLRFTLEAGTATVTLPRLDVYSLLVFQLQDL